MRRFYRRLFCQFWSAYSSLAGAALIAGVVSAVIVFAFSGKGPVIITSDVQLLTPRVPAGGIMSFSVWRQSTESCRGTAVVSFTPLGDDADAIISVRYPLATPGFQSPPRLTVSRQLPRQVVPGKWYVRVGVESECPTRTQYDRTAEFVIEVYDDK